MEDIHLLANTREGSGQPDVACILDLLNQHVAVKKVIPHLPHEIFVSTGHILPGQSLDLIGIQLKEDTVEAAERLIRSTRIFKAGIATRREVSCVFHPASSMHSCWPAFKRRRMGISDSFILIRVGAEPLESLIGDLSYALERVDHTHSWKKHLYT